MKDTDFPAGWPSNYPGFTDPKPVAKAPPPAVPPDEGASTRRTDLLMAMALVLLILVVGVPLLVASILLGG